MGHAPNGYRVGNRHGAAAVIFTVAEKEPTDKLFAERAGTGQRVYKDGMNGRSRGGAAWEKREEAQSWIDKQAEAQAPATNGLAVYGVEGEWERDCVQFDHEPFRRLVIARPMVQL